ncbi:MAG: cytochrome-c peroxidase [Chitinophagaceae bacterium]|nr:cytochrome-c peroxidase [Chitinophagaceae bacterium]
MVRYKLSILLVIVIAYLSFLVNACRKNDVIKYNSPEPVNFVTPEGFPAPVYNFAGNPLTRQGIELGRQLFHESKLALYNDVNCGSCHQQHAGFTQFDHDLGHGTNHQHTTRNPPGIFNMVWHTSFKWDGSVATLPDMVESCLMAPEKMSQTYEGLIPKLDTSANYKKLFGEAFGDENITGERIKNALTQFVATIVSADSKYDRVKKGEAVFNESEQQGYELFKAKCAACHQEPLFTDFSFRNNGLPVSEFHPDYGRMDFTHNPSDSIKFKVASLRNVEVTGYYTHDGRFSGLTEMLDHYSENIVQSNTLDPLLVNKIPLDNLEKFYLLEFLFTLTDSTMLTNPAFGN